MHPPGSRSSTVLLSPRRRSGPSSGSGGASRQNAHRAAHAAVLRTTGSSRGGGCGRPTAPSSHCLGPRTSSHSLVRTARDDGSCDRRESCEAGQHVSLSVDCFATFPLPFAAGDAPGGPWAPGGLSQRAPTPTSAHGLAPQARHRSAGKRGFFHAHSTQHFGQCWSHLVRMRTSSGPG